VYPVLKHCQIVDTPGLNACNADTAAAMSVLDEVHYVLFVVPNRGFSQSEKQFLQDRLRGKGYKPRSFFAGATPENAYSPTMPYSITVSENPYSFYNENWATLYVTSGGADTPRQIKLRKKPSTGQWFLNEIQCLADIRVPKEEDPWA